MDDSGQARGRIARLFDMDPRSGAVPMPPLRILLALPMAALILAATTATAAAHNAGCVQTGDGTWISVGSGKSSPAVAEQNPRSSDDPPRVGNFLDLTPETTGDQYGARYAVIVGSAVQHPSNC
jgi:hypothetical protein